MDDSQVTQWDWWPMALFGDLGEVLTFVLVVGLLLVRVLPSTRRWAPRGNARSTRPGSAARVSGTRVPSPSPVRRR